VFDVAEQTDMVKRRWGRTTAFAHYHTQTQEIIVSLPTSQAELLLAGPMFSSRAAYYISADTANRYGWEDYDGYLDVFPYEYSAEPMGVADGHTEITLIGSVQE
jgi:hypothetical protein